ncbi:MAG: LysR family transcriptional regulator [Granulosicoccaceae bacterium]
MQTRTLKTLIRISKIGSFADAAVQLNMTLSAVSMQMKSLETELGVRIFDRSFRPPKLTPIGILIVKQATTLLSAEEELIQLSNTCDQLVGHFRMGFVTTASVQLLPNFLKNAAKWYPEATFTMETGLSETLETKLLNGQLDAVIVTASDQVDSTLSYDHLYHEPLMYAAPGALASFSLKDLVRKKSFLQFAPNTGIGKLISYQIAKIHTEKSKPIIILNNVETIVECVKQNLGFTLLPKYDIQRYADDTIRIFCPKNAQLSREIVLVTTNTGLGRDQIEMLKGLVKSKIDGLVDKT